MYYGLKEVAGAGDNAVIVNWAKKLKVSSTYQHDEMAWCGLFVAYCLASIGLTPPKGVDMLRALKYAEWSGGVRVNEPAFGDLIVVKRYDRKGSLVGGHVAIIVGETPNSYLCLGGNQGDQVSIAPVGKQRQPTFVRPMYKTPQKIVKPPKFSNEGQPVSEA